MKTTFPFAIFLSILISSNIFAKPYIAKVTFIKGIATELSPGSKKATRIKLNQKFKEGSSILTYDKSVLKIQFFDGSKTTLGPKSKLVIKRSNPKKGSILGLLKGTIRNQLDKTKKKKLFIKTRTAALGVRGTDFQTIYNPDIKITSLVTFTGKVAMAKVKKTSLKRHTNNHQQHPQKKYTYEIDYVHNVMSATSLNDEFAEFDAVLDTKEAVEIKPGRFSTTATKLSKPTIPVRISPAQFKVMKKNTNLTEGNQVGIKNIEKETVKAHVTENIKIEAGDPPPEGYTNLAKNEFAPKSGGFLDINSGIYVPPEADAKYNMTAEIFIPKKIGNVSKKTGEYVAPEGLKLDPKAGFVAKVDDEEVLEKKEELNKEIKKIVQTEKRPEEKKPSRWFKGPINPQNKYKIGHHQIQLGLIPGGNVYRYENPYENGTTRTLHTEGKGDLRLEYSYRFSKKIMAGISMLEGDRTFKLEKAVCTGPDCGDMPDSQHFGRRFLFLGLFANDRTYMRIGLGEAETPVPRHQEINEWSTDDQYGKYWMEDTNNTAFILTFNRVFLTGQKFKLMGELLFAFLPEKDDHGKTSKGLEFAPTMELVYELNTWFGLFAEANYSYRSLKVTNSYDYNNTSSEHKYRIHNYGIGFGVLFSI